MKRWLALLFFMLILPHPGLASEPAYDTLPPELVRLRDEGRLTVRALWAWKLVPSSTTGMAMEFRALGLDLISADRAQLASWLGQADEGKLALSQAQRDVLEQLISRMDEGLPSGEESVAAPSVASEPSVVEADGKRDVPDPGEMIRELGVQAEGGNPKAKVSLALAARAGLDGPPDPVRSVALLEDAAAAGDADAMALLADEYDSGILVPYDPQKASTLREQAAKSGSLLARWALEEK